MGSEYEYITVAILENYTSEDYGAIDATYLTDVKVEAKITAAEQLINAFIGLSFSSPIPDGIVYATKDIAKRMIYVWMRENGMKMDKEKLLESRRPYLSDEIKEILDLYKSRKVVPIKLHHLYNNDPTVFI